MTRRRKILIIVVLVLLIVALALYLFLSRKPQAAPAAPSPAPAETQPAPETTTVQATSQVAALNPIVAPAEQHAGEVQMAELFAARYGSYSNQESYTNLRDLLPIMTASYRASAEALIAKGDNQPPAGMYQGVTSVKVSSKEIAHDATSATVDVNLQQTTSSGTSAPTVGYKTLRVKLLKAGEDWRVDSAAWR